MSDGGVKLLFAKMLEFYNSLTIPEKKQFSMSYNNINSPPACPLDKKPIFFWKFLNQYLCFTGVKRVIPTKSRFSPELIRNITFLNWTTQSTGGSSDVKIFSILDRLGFANDYNIIGTIRNSQNYSLYYQNKIKKWMNKPPVSDPHFIISFPRPNLTQKPKIDGYTLISSVISVSCNDGNCGVNTNGATKVRRKDHAITGIIYNDKSYLIDPNNLKPIPCRWWNQRDLISVVNNEFSDFYFNRNVRTRFRYKEAFVEYMIFAKTNYINKISPACIQYTNTVVYKNRMSRRIIKPLISPSQLSHLVKFSH